MKTAITVLEWALGLIATGAMIFSLIMVMFTNDPNFSAHLSALQKFVFDTQGFFLVVIPGIVLVSFIAHFFVKASIWNHIVGIVGVIGIVYSLIFLSAY